MINIGEGLLTGNPEFWIFELSEKNMTERGFKVYCSVTILLTEGCVTKQYVAFLMEKIKGQFVWDNKS